MASAQNDKMEKDLSRLTNKASFLLSTIFPGGSKPAKRSPSLSKKKRIMRLSSGYSRISKQADFLLRAYPPADDSSTDAKISRTSSGYSRLRNKADFLLGVSHALSISGPSSPASPTPPFSITPPIRESVPSGTRDDAALPTTPSDVVPSNPTSPTAAPPPLKKAVSSSSTSNGSGSTAAAKPPNRRTVSHNTVGRTRRNRRSSTSGSASNPTSKRTLKRTKAGKGAGNSRKGKSGGRSTRGAKQRSKSVKRPTGSATPMSMARKSKRSIRDRIARSNTLEQKTTSPPLPTPPIATNPSSPTERPPTHHRRRRNMRSASVRLVKSKPSKSVTSVFRAGRDKGHKPANSGGNGGSLRKTDSDDFLDMLSQLSAVKKARAKQTKIIQPGAKEATSSRGATPSLVDTDVEEEDDDDDRKSPTPRALTRSMFALPAALAPLSKADPQYEAKKGAYEFILLRYQKNPRKIRQISYHSYMDHASSSSLPPLDPQSFQEQLANVRAAIRQLAEQVSSPTSPSSGSGTDRKAKSSSHHFHGSKTSSGDNAPSSNEDMSPSSPVHSASSGTSDKQRRTSGRLDSLFKHADTCFESGDYEQAVSCFQVLASAGHTQAQYRMACCYDRGLGVERDLAAAVKYFRLAAEQGHASAQASIAACYYNGQGVSKDDAKAVEWFTRAAESGNAEAMYLLGGCYALGEVGLDQSWTKAIELYKKAAALDHAEAMCALARCMMEGRTRKRSSPDADAPEPFEITLEVSSDESDDDNSDSDDSVSMSVSISFLPDSSPEATEDQKDAFRLYKKCADKFNHPLAHCYSGICLQRGLGTKKDISQAVEHYMSAAAQQHPRGLALLAHCYWRGLGLKDRNRSKAQRLYEKSAALGDSLAQRKLFRITQDALEFLAPAASGRTLLKAMLTGGSSPGSSSKHPNTDAKELQSRRRDTLQELMSSESLYTYHLGLLCEKYIGPICDLELADHIQESVEITYKALQKMLHVHLGLVSDFRTCEKALVIPKLLAAIPLMAPCYMDIVSQYMILIRQVAGAMASRELRRFLDTTCKQYGHQSIAQLLILPIQRIPRYLLLLVELEKFTPPGHKSLAVTQKALKLLKQMAIDLDERQTQARQEYRM